MRPTRTSLSAPTRLVRVGVPLRDRSRSLPGAVPAPGRRVLLAGALAWGLAACGSRGADDVDRPAPVAPPRTVRTGSVSLAGPPAFLPFMKGLAARYQSLYPGVTVRADVLPMAPLLAQLRARALGFALLPRRLGDAGRDLFGFPVARDGLAVLVRRDHPLQALALAELTLRLRAGGAARLAVHDPQGRVGDLVEELFRIDARGVPRLAAGIDPVTWFQGAGRDTDDVLLTTLDVALGFASGAKFRGVAIDGVAATPRNLRKGDYPLMAPVNLVTRDLPAGEARLFVDFCLSAQISDLVRQHGLIPYAD